MYKIPRNTTIKNKENTSTNLKSLWLEEIIINDFSVIKSSLMSPKSSLKGPKKPL